MAGEDQELGGGGEILEQPGGGFLPPAVEIDQGVIEEEEAPSLFQEAPGHRQADGQGFSPGFLLVKCRQYLPDQLPTNGFENRARLQPPPVRSG